MFCLIISFIIENIKHKKKQKNYKQVPTNIKHLTFI